MSRFQIFTPPKRVITFDPNGRRASKRPWVKFELADPTTLQVMIVAGKQVKIGTIDAATSAEHKAQIELFLAQVQKAADGRLVGIFCPGGVFTTPGGLVDGKPLPDHRVYVPASIIPQRANLGDSGEQNMSWQHAGQVHRLLLPFESLKNVEALPLDQSRDDVPKHRVATMDPNYVPARG